MTNRLAELQRRDARVEDAQRGVDGGGERELLIRQELDASLMAANKYASNYSAWSHRIWCLQQLGPFISSTVSYIGNSIVCVSVFKSLTIDITYISFFSVL